MKKLKKKTIKELAGFLVVMMKIKVNIKLLSEMKMINLVIIKMAIVLKIVS